MEGVVELEKHLSELRQTFRSGRTRSASWRKAQLRAILSMIKDNEHNLFEALRQDLGKHPVEAYRDELGVVVKSATYALTNFEKWMAPKKARIPLLFYPAKGEVLPEPLGLVLIFSSWNYPISLALDPIIGAISAGNTVVLKPSEMAPASSALLANTIPCYLDDKAVKVIQGGSNVAEQLLRQRWDKIFFTGSPRVARIIMSAASKHLTPVTLELGGKSPLILDSLSNPSEMKVAAQRIAAAKWGATCGQACIAIDYVLVENKFAHAMIDLVTRVIKKFYGEDPKNLKNLCKIVNKQHFERLRNILEDTDVAASIVHGGSLDEEKLMIEPTVLLNPPLDSELMNEEIFGPVLPFITVSKIEESIEFINSKPKPLVIYAFTKNEALKKKITTETSSGSLTFNDAMIQFLIEELPFGGVGESGIGRYHGKYSFDTFSHEKAVLHRSYLLELEPRYPPWNDFKLQFLKLAYAFAYVKLLLLLLGSKLKSAFGMNQSNKEKKNK